jgi:hypothetical protein
LKIALWVLWGFVAVSLLVAMISFEVYLPDNFGAAAHDGFLLFPNNKTAFAILPVNGYLVKPQGWFSRVVFMCLVLVFCRADNALFQRPSSPQWTEFTFPSCAKRGFTAATAFCWELSLLFWARCSCSSSAQIDLELIQWRR